MAQLKVIKISDITPDVNQPRKFFDDNAMAELTQSVTEKGVLQPILVRPAGNAYSLVCGERRFRASTAAGLLEIPAMIRDLSDEEALELQIIENLQRKDVHPMEEAVAFKSLMEGKSWTVQEVATRVGKKDFYVRQRLKLNELIYEWQQLFYKNKFTLTEALQICLLPEKAQTDFYKTEVDHSNISNFVFNDYRIKQYKGDLHKATFSLEDPTLDKTMGQCTTCQYNTAVSLLFPDHANAPRCMNVSCYKHKSDVFFDRELKQVKEDPEVIFINTGYTATKIVDQLSKEGYQVLKEYSDYKEVEAPEKPDWEEFKDENFAEEEGDDIEEVHREFETTVIDYEKEKAAYEKKIATGKYKKAFEVAGHDPGQYKYIELMSTGKIAKTAVESGDGSLREIEAEIQRIKDRETRSKELDAEKVHVIVVSALKDHPSMKSTDRSLTDVDKVLMRYLVYEQVDFSIRSEIERKTFLVEPGYHSTIQQRRAWFKKLGNLTDNQFAYMLRKILLSKYHSNLPQMSGGFALRLLADSLGDIPIAEFENSQEEVASKRSSRVNKRIEDLEKQMQSLQPATKKSTKQKATVTK